MTFQILPPWWNGRYHLPPYLVRNTASFQPLACRGSKSVQAEKKDLKWDERRSRETWWWRWWWCTGGLLLQTGMVVWDELKWGEDTKEGGEDNLLHQHVRGDCFLLKQDRARWTLFLLIFGSACLFVCFIVYCFIYIYLCCLFNLLIQRQYLHDEESVSPCMFCYLKRYTLLQKCSITVRCKWCVSVACKVAKA